MQNFLHWKNTYLRDELVFFRSVKTSKKSFPENPKDKVFWSWGVWDTLRVAPVGLGTKPLKAFTI